MTEHAFPRKPYAEVSSEFIREEIRRGSFEDVEYRRYVNELVWLEWHTSEGVDRDTSGISRFSMAVHRWRVAAAIPEAYDAVQRDLDAPTRSEKEWNWYGEEDPDERRRWARRHREEWRAVQRGEQRPPGARTELETRGHRSFAPFRFPVSPYDALQSPFVREEIRRGTFDDIEYRRYVNKLAWIEWYTTDWEQGGAWGPVITNWRIASEYPEEFDIVRRELDEETRASLDLSGGIYYGDIDAEAAAREYKRSWQAVQETARDGFPSQTTGSEARRNP